jgi:protein dithiol oxidoreductase (disulfide-forming)
MQHWQKFLSVAVLSFFAWGNPVLAQTSSASSPKFVNVNPPQPTEPGKIEVLEFFSYGCPHCAVLEPMVQAWRKTLPSDVAFYGVPVAFNAGMKPLQYLYYALDAVGRSDLHAQVFKTIHDDKKRIFTESAIIDWAASQGIDRAKFESAFKSFGVKSKATRADQLAQAYGLQGTPSIAVAGRFMTSPTEAGGYQQTVDEANRLVSQVRN